MTNHTAPSSAPSDNNDGSKASAKAKSTFDAHNPSRQEFGWFARVLGREIAIAPTGEGRITQLKELWIETVGRAGRDRSLLDRLRGSADPETYLAALVLTVNRWDPAQGGLPLFRRYILPQQIGREVVAANDGVAVNGAKVSLEAYQMARGFEARRDEYLQSSGDLGDARKRGDLCRELHDEHHEVEYTPEQIARKSVLSRAREVGCLGALTAYERAIPSGIYYQRLQGEAIERVKQHLAALAPEQDRAAILAAADLESAEAASPTLAQSLADRREAASVGYQGSLRQYLRLSPERKAALARTAAVLREPEQDSRGNLGPQRGDLQMLHSWVYPGRPPKVTTAGQAAALVQKLMTSGAILSKVHDPVLREFIAARVGVIDWSRTDAREWLREAMRECLQYGLEGRDGHAPEAKQQVATDQTQEKGRDVDVDECTYRIQLRAAGAEMASIEASSANAEWRRALTPALAGLTERQQVGQVRIGSMREPDRKAYYQYCISQGLRGEDRVALAAVLPVSKLRDLARHGAPGEARAYLAAAKVYQSQRDELTTALRRLGERAKTPADRALYVGLAADVAAAEWDPARLRDAEEAVAQAKKRGDLALTQSSLGLDVDEHPGVLRQEQRTRAQHDRAVTQESAARSLVQSELVFADADAGNKPRDGWSRAETERARQGHALEPLRKPFINSLREAGAERNEAEVLWTRYHELTQAEPTALRAAERAMQAHAAETGKHPAEMSLMLHRWLAAHAPASIRQLADLSPAEIASRVYSRDEPPLVQQSVAAPEPPKTKPKEKVMLLEPVGPAPAEPQPPAPQAAEQQLLMACDEWEQSIDKGQKKDISRYR